MSLPDPTLEDLVIALRLSNKPNIIVEGKDDEIIYRTLVERLGRFDVGFFSASSKSTLLRLYEELSQYESRGDFRHVPVAFIADRDMWLFSGIPEGYADIIWTQGYSIENDLYVSAELESFLETHQHETHQQILNAVCRWFAFEVEAFLKGDAAYIAEGLDEIVPRGKTELDDAFLKRRGFLSPQEERYQQIRDAYGLQLRGKLLFQILLRFLNAADRELRFQTTHHGLFAIALDRPVSSQLFDRLIHEVERKLSDQKQRLPQ